VTYNPILKGVRVRNRTVSRRENSTGRRKSVKAPPEELSWPSLIQILLV